VDRAYVGAEYTRDLLRQGTALISKARGIAANDGYFDKSDFTIESARQDRHLSAGQSVIDYAR